MTVYDDMPTDELIDYTIRAASAVLLAAEDPVAEDLSGVLTALAARLATYQPIVYGRVE